ncbi:unnamed protein product, partial [Candidula unifasciata]
MEVGSRSSHRLTAVEALKLMQEVMQGLSDPENIEDLDVKYEVCSSDSDSSDCSNHSQRGVRADKFTSSHQSFHTTNVNGTSLQPGPSKVKRPKLSSYHDSDDQWHEVDSPSQVKTKVLYDFCPKNGGNPGVTPNLTAESTPLDCFLQIFTDDVANVLLDSLNNCTRSHIPRNSHAWNKSETAASWAPMDIFELRKFIAVTTAMSLDRRSLLHNYFSKHPALYTPFYSQMFTREHFRKIFCAVQALGNPNADAKNKIEPFAKILVERFSEAFTPFEKVAVDEMIIENQGRWYYKQMNTSKPAKHRVKSFGLIDSSTGYIVNLYTYFGSNTGYDTDSDSDELGGDAEDIFRTLLSPLGTGYHIFADKWYTTRSLINSLLDKQYHYTGQVQAGREGFPAALINMELEPMESRYWLLLDESLLCVTWLGRKDQEPVTIVSSKAVEEVKAPGKSKPIIIDKYNTRIHCCDTGMKTENFNLFDKKSRQWWKKMFHWLLEIATINAHRLYVLTRPSESKPQDLTLEAFKLHLIEQLALFATGATPGTGQLTEAGRARVFNPVERLQDAKHIISYDKSDLRCKVCSTPKNVKRTHFVCEG